MIHVVTGPPCAGKSTLVESNAEPGDLRIDYDAIAKALGAVTPHGSEGHVRRAALAARRAAIDIALLAPEQETWIIHTNPTTAQMDTYKDLGAEVTELDPGIEECLARAAADDRPDGTAEAITAWYDARAEPKGTDMQVTPGRAPKYKTGETLVKDVNVKIETTREDGDYAIVEAIVSVFGNVDAYGDVVMPGAYTEDLAAWAASGDPIPGIWAHEWRDPFMHIGEVLKAEETEKGLWARLKLDIAENPTAAQVYRLLKARRVKQFSFAYDIEDAGWASRKDEATGAEYEVYELRKLHIIEVGPCLVGANRETELLAVKVEQLTEAVKDGSLDPTLLSKLDRLAEALKSSPEGDTQQDGQPATAASTKTGSHTEDVPANGEPEPASPRMGIEIAKALIGTLEG